MRTLPLALVFASLAAAPGCGWFGSSCGAKNVSYVESLDQSELDDLLAILGRGDTGDTDDTDTPATDLSCEDVCGRYGDEVVSCAEIAPTGAAVYAAECEIVSICIGGRLHEVVQTPRADFGTDGLGAHLAQMAHDEWASVAAFQALEVEIRAHGAPADLRIRVLRAASEEIGHAKAIAALAHQHGGSVPEPVIVPLSTRSLEAIARENVVEAVVLETWAALRATVQAERALDADFRQAMQIIAVEETQHAELARELDHWFRSQLDAEANQRLDHARDEAFAELLSNAQNPMPAGIQAQLGWPDPETSKHLLQGLAAALWA